MRNQVIIYLTGINILSLIIILIDKILHKKNKSYFNEKFLLTLASLGGALAMYIIMSFVKYKEKEKNFMKKFYLIFIFWLVLSIILIM